MNVTDSDFKTEVLDYKGLVLVDFWAPWCGPCRMMTPVIEEIAKEKKDIVKVMQMNVDEESATAEKYQIMGIPAFLLFKDGELVDSTNSLQSKESIVEMIQKHI